MASPRDERTGSLTAQQKKIQQIIIYGQPPEGVECLKKEL